MRMRHCLAPGIRGPWRRAGLAAVAIAAVGVVSYAAAGDPLSDLKAGVTAFESQRYAAAIALLQPLAKRLLWFAALWLAGVGGVATLSLLLHLWLSPR